jgi:hypothetical protein
MIYAAGLTGTGYGKTQDEAKREALSSLAQTIKSEVHTAIISRKSASVTDATSSIDKTVKVTSNLPIIGVDLEFTDMYDTYEALATLVPEKAAMLYEKKLETLFKEITTLHQNVALAKSSVEKAELLGRLLDRINEFERYQSVAIVVGVENIPASGVNRAQVESDLLALDKRIDSLEMAAAVLSKTFAGYERVYLYPPKHTQSHEITPFAGAVKMHLAAKLHTVSTPADAKHWLIGEYSESGDGLVLSYTLIDVSTRGNKAARTLTLPAQAFGSYRAKPKNVSFDKLLHEGIVVSDKLQVSLATNKGTEDLLFTKGEELELLVKLNKPGYFYMVGFTQTDEGKHAYLVELQEGSGFSRFVKFVNGDDANRWISLGAFTVEPPFGIETLQVIASDHKITELPSHHYDDQSGYYLIGEGVQKGLATTRGFLKKKSKKAVKAEAVLMLTTMER